MSLVSLFYGPSHTRRFPLSGFEINVPAKCFDALGLITGEKEGKGLLLKSCVTDASADLLRPNLETISHATIAFFARQIPTHPEVSKGILFGVLCYFAADLYNT